MTDHPPRVFRSAARCAVRCVRLLGAGRLHLRTARIGSDVRLPDGRVYVVFRESSCDQADPGSSLLLAVWFTLRSIPPGAFLRRWLFERLCIVNTVLFAGFDGYLVKLWMVNPTTSDYAGLYSWRSAEEAERYAGYITAILRPISRPGSVGYETVADTTLDDHLARTRVSA